MNNYKEAISSKLARYFGTTPEEASGEQMYKASVLAVRDLLTARRSTFRQQTTKQTAKQVYYLCMEFLLGRSLKMNLCNMGLEDEFSRLFGEWGFDIEDIYAYEDDAGLGNGGLGRLAACFFDSLASLGYPATGFSICYEYGLFRQRVVGGEQIELPDIWMPSGEGWLVQRQDESKKVRFGGHVTEKWTDHGLEIIHTDYDEVEAVPYDMMVSGAGGGASLLRLWRARDIRNFNMKLFSQGQYIKAVEENTNAETISKVLYPDDHHTEGKLLRLSQQYFLVSASLQTILSDHLETYKTLVNLPEKVAIHINDTHPALAVPEMMRLLMDVYGFSWERAWYTTVNTMSYTNHTVMPEALECWNEDLFRLKLPRIYNIVREINERFCRELWQRYTGNWDKISRMAVIGNQQVRMANLCVVGSHTVNGVSALHSKILKDTVFRDFYELYPDRFINVTNGIAHRRWLCYSNPSLAELIGDCIGESYRTEPERLTDLLKYRDDVSVLDRLSEVKRANKVRFSEMYAKRTGIVIDPDSVFDVQVKRLHEYKRQLLNVLSIISLYAQLLENPSVEMRPRTFLFGAKAAPGYYHAKEVIKLICALSAEIEKNPRIREKMRVVFIENYNVTAAEQLIPASDISEQISLAGKEASGTGNMKFMINGALTVGTLDGANVEIREAVGDDNIFIFGLTTPEVDALWHSGYESSVYYNRNELLKKAVDMLNAGFDAKSFAGIANYLLFAHGVADPYMCLADFDEFTAARRRAWELYENRRASNPAGLINIANAGRIATDRSIKQYADLIWHIKPVL